MTSPFVVTAEHVHVGGGVLTPGWVAMSGGRIVEVGEGRPTRADLSVHRLSPGLVDAHCHGGGGGDFGGTDDDIARAIACHRRAGTTSTIASLVSAPIDVLATQVRRLREHVRAGGLAGIHLEGPWISAAQCGAHDPLVLTHPNATDVDNLITAGGDAIRMVTLAPELPGALNAIRQLVDAGVAVAVGHTTANAAQVTAAVDAGATVATHLFNAMPSLHHRDPGPVGALLMDDRVTVELIDDGVHVAASVVDLATRAAGPGRWMLVTDAIAAAGAGDGHLQLGGVGVDVLNGVARLARNGALAGSTLMLAEAVRRQVGRGHDPDHVVSAATTTPAYALGLATGVLQPEAPADLVAFDADWRVTHVYVAGVRQLD